MYCGCAVSVEINSNKIKIWIMLMKLGAITGCHQLHDRSFYFRTYQYPVCARCTGLFFGQLIGVLTFRFTFNIDIRILLFCAVIAVLALGVDGVGQLKKYWTSTNTRRLITGLLCGFSVASCTIALIIKAVGIITGHNAV
jgi:uncharacterized membrane protein